MRQQVMAGPFIVCSISQFFDSASLSIVFDASSHGIDGKALNENLESGPNLNSDFMKLLLNFRTSSNSAGRQCQEGVAFLQPGMDLGPRDTLRLWHASSLEQENPFPDV
ncbi:hypothetical protein MTO96_023510 [Rhipicephalus appendiculatus]